MLNISSIETMLYNYPKTKAKIKNLKLEMEDLEEAYPKISYGMPPTPTQGSIVENLATSNKIEQLKKKIDKLSREVQRIENALSILNDRERTIIELTYFQKLSSYIVGHRLDLDSSTVRRKKRKIVDEILTPLLNNKYTEKEQ